MINFATSFLILLIALLSFSTIDRDGPSYLKANQMEVRFFKGQRFIYKTSDKNHLSFFKEMVTKSKNDLHLKCDTTGEIIYLKNNKPLFRVYFSSKITGSKFKNSSVTYSINGQSFTSLITYNAGMILDEIFYNHNSGKNSR